MNDEALDTIKIRVWVSESRETIEFDRAQWDGMTNDEREAQCRNIAFHQVDWGWLEC